MRSWRNWQTRTVQVTMRTNIRFYVAYTSAIRYQTLVWRGFYDIANKSVFSEYSRFTPSLVGRNLPALTRDINEILHL